MARAVEDQPLHSAGPDFVGQNGEELVRPNVRPGEEDDLCKLLLDGLAQRQPERLGGLEDLSGPFFEGHVQPRLLAFCALEDELEPQRRLSDARASGHEGDAPLEQSSAEQLVEARNAGERATRGFRRWRGLRDPGLFGVPGEDPDPPRPDDQVVPALGVGGVAQLVDLKVPLALEGLLARGEQDDAVDHRLLHAEAAELGGAVGDVSGEKADRLRVLDDGRELEGLLTADLRILDLVQEDRERVENDASGSKRLHPLAHHEEVRFHHDVRLGDEDDLEHPAIDLRVEVPAQAPANGAQPLLGLLEGEDDSFLARLSAAVEEFEAEDRLPGPGHARYQQGGAERDAFTEKVVEPGGARLEPLRAARAPLRSVLAVDGDARGEDLDAARGNDERVLVAAMLGPAHLGDLDEALLLAGLLALVERQDAVNDGKERVRLAVPGTVLAEEQRGGLPRHEVDGELVAELPQLLMRLGQVVERLEAVHHDDGGLHLLDVLHDETGGSLEPLAPQDDAEIHELDSGLDLGRVEELELAQVAQGLGRRLRERVEVEHARLGRGVVEADLLGEDRLARARRPAEDGDRPLRQPTQEERIEVPHTGLDARNVTLFIHDFASSPGTAGPAATFASSE